MEKKVKIDYRAPLYLQVCESILKKIETGEYLPGQQLPSERIMADMYGINRMTVRNAVDKLTEQGILESYPRKGAFVARNHSKQLMNANFRKVLGFGAFITSNGIQNSSSVFGYGKLKDDNLVRSRLNLKNNEQVCYLYRVRKADNEPIAVEYCYVPEKYFNDMDQHDFSKTSLYSYMDFKKHSPIRFKQSLILVKCSYELAKLLKTEEGSPLYLFAFIGTDADHNVVEFTKSYMRCDKVVFNYTAIRQQAKQ